MMLFHNLFFALQKTQVGHIGKHSMRFHVHKLPIKCYRVDCKQIYSNVTIISISDKGISDFEQNLM